MFNPDEPFFLQWHITDQCNFNCVHCYRDSIKQDLSYDGLKRVFSNFERLRALMHQKKARVQIAGGEPLLSGHLFSVLELIANAGFQSRILTNGSLIDPANAKRIKDCGCHIVQISIDGAPDTHDAIRGRGNYQRAVEGAGYLRERDIQVTFAMTLTKRNKAEIGLVFDEARKYANRLSFHRLVPCGRGSDLKKDLLTKEEIKKVFDEIWRLRNSDSSLEIPLRDPLWKPYIRCLNLEPYADGCSVGYGGICIESNGDVYPCRRLPVKLGNALSEELTDIWHSSLLNQLRNRDLLKGRCSTCSLRWKCGGCRAIGLAVKDDMFAEDPQCFCQLSFLENLAFKMINRLNRNSYHDFSQGGG
ncbi:MAG: radical SAM protein [Candidatus Aureabacteria bacterium]|nr:radical SAM protein [Candidatus Auribacterota bacterium]